LQRDILFKNTASYKEEHKTAKTQNNIAPYYISNRRDCGEHIFHRPHSFTYQVNPFINNIKPTITITIIMSNTAATRTKTTTPITPVPSAKTLVHLKSPPPLKKSNHSNGKVNNNNSNNNDDNNSLFGELDSEIAKMSADADAILESIRLAASASSPQAVTPGSSSSSSTSKSTGSKKKLTLSNLLKGQKQDALNQKRLENNDDDDDDDDDMDDDMTDDGSVPEQVRLDLAAELREVENSFAPLPRLRSKQVMPMPTTITTTTKRRTATPTKTTAVACTPVNATTPPSSSLSSPGIVWIDFVLILMIFLTWTIIATTMYVIVRENYMVLNDKGEMILFSSSIQDVLFSSATSDD
jgi:hypothetical protein